MIRAGTGKRGRPPVIDDRTRAEIMRRLAGGETPSELQKIYKIPRTTFVRNFSDDVTQIREIGTALARAEIQMAELPFPVQISVRMFADNLKSIQMNLAEAAIYGSATSKCLAQKAHGIAATLGDDFGVDGPDRESLRAVSALSLTSTEASKIAMGFIATNRETGKPQEKTLEDLLEEANQVYEARKK